MRLSQEIKELKQEQPEILGEVRGRLSRFQASASSALLTAGGWTERFSLPLLVVLLAVYACWVLAASLSTPLWHDELITFAIAKAPTWRGMLALSRQVDLNPPLSYLLTRVSFRLFGAGTLACRLPEMLGFAFAPVGLYLFVRRRAGGAYGLFAAALLISGKASELAYEARPYGLMLGCGAMTLALWQLACDLQDRRTADSTLDWRLRFATAGLALAACGLLLSHPLGRLLWACVALGELSRWRWPERRSVLRLLALAAPLLCLLHSRAPVRPGHAVYPAAFQPSGNTIFEYTIGHIDRELVCLWLTALVIVIVAGRTWLRGGAGMSLHMEEWVAIMGILAIPCLVIGLVLLRRGAFFERYGIGMSLGVCVLFAVFLRWWAGGRAAAAMIATLLALLISGRLPDAVAAVGQGHLFRTGEPQIASSGLEAGLDPALPLVAASGLTFVEMNFREPPSLLDHTFYLLGRKRSLQYAQSNIWEGKGIESALLGYRGKTEAYPQFLAEHPRFYVLGTYDYPEDWLLRALLAEGQELRLVRHVEASYKDHELYEVTVRTIPTGLTDPASEAKGAQAEPPEGRPTR